MPSGTPWSVLLIEDASDTTHALTQLLRGAGASVVSSGSAGEALKVAQSESFDVILIDLGLPDIPGDVVIRHVLQTARRRPRVVVMTGHDETWQQRARDAGADAVLTKPLNWAELMVAMRGPDAGIPVVSPTKAA